MSDESETQDLINYLNNLGTTNNNSELYTKTNKQRKEEGLSSEDLRTILPNTIKDPFNDRFIRGNPKKPPRYLTPIEKKSKNSKSKTAYTKAERKAYALHNGKEVKYIACLMCGRNRPMKNITKDGRRSGAFGDYNSETNTFVPYMARLLQIRKGGGRQVGFFHKESKNLTELYTHDNPLFNNIRSVAKQIVEECDKIKEGYVPNTDTI